MNRIHVELGQYEIEHLIAWHREQQFDAANREQYADAEDHKRLASQLAKILADAREKWAAKPADRLVG